jgi:hypothetical protein
MSPLLAHALPSGPLTRDVLVFAGRRRGLGRGRPDGRRVPELFHRHQDPSDPRDAEGDREGGRDTLL